MSYEFYDRLLKRVEDMQRTINKIRDLIKSRIQELRKK